MKPFTIGQAADAAGVSVETVRFYERKGLISQPQRPSNGGPRDYGRGIVERLRFIRQAKEIGFTLTEAADLLALRTDDNAECEDVRLRAVAKRRDVQTKLERLERIRDTLDELIARCPGKGGMSACSIISAMESRPGIAQGRSQS